MHIEDTTAFPFAGGLLAVEAVGTGVLPVEAPPAVVRRQVDEEADPIRLLRRYRDQAIAGDALSAAAAASVAGAVLPGEVYAGIPVLAAPAWVAMVALRRSYGPWFTGTGAELRRVCGAGLLALAVIAGAALLLGLHPERSVVLLGLALAVAGSVLLRLGLRHRLRNRRARGLGIRRVLVVGQADSATALVERFDAAPEHGLEVVGVCAGAVGEGGTGEVVEAVRATRAHVVVVAAHPDLSGPALRRLGWALEERGVDLVVAPGLEEVAGSRVTVHPVAGTPLLHLARPGAGARPVAKAVFDRTVAAALLLVLSPLMLTISVLVRATSTGPALFRQTRVGTSGTPFTILKFRSMAVGAEHRRAELAGTDDGNGVLFKLHADPRVTRTGAWLRRFSLDELPQLVNVVNGSMSLVGPRPPLPEEVAGYDEVALRRLRVKPGLTGLWQVSGRSDLSWEESLRLDLRYVDNWSIGTDLAILGRTVGAVVRGTGAY